MTKKFIAWGHKLHSHTHSYIHCAYVKAFDHMGWETMHLDNEDDISNIDFNNSIFLTEGQVEQKIPIIKNCKYILHYPRHEWKYADLPKENVLRLGVYTNGISHDSVGVSGEQINEYTYFDEESRTLYQPWATDLLPEEITSDFNHIKNKKIVYCGTLWDGWYGNINQINNFLTKSKSFGYDFMHHPPGRLSFDENRSVIRNNELSPTIVGEWQKINHYIPCRIFKNISYGALGLTNSEVVKRIFGDTIVYSENESEILEKYIAIQDSEIKRKFLASLEIVSNNHTYINRINQILKVL